MMHLAEGPNYQLTGAEHMAAMVPSKPTEFANTTTLPDLENIPSIVDHERFLTTKYGDIKLSGLENSGDLANWDHGILIQWMNHVAEIYAKAKLEDYEMNGENSAYAKKVREFDEHLSSFEGYVDGKIAEKAEAMELLKAKYKAADEQAALDIAENGLEGEEAMIRRAAYRILAAQKDITSADSPLEVEMVSDFDLTMTKGEDKDKKYSEKGTEDARVYLEPNIPSSVPAEEHIERYGRETFNKLFALYWNDFLGDAPQMFEEGGRGGRVPLRDGVDKFFTWAKDKGWDVNIVSANFGRFAHQALAGIPDIDRAGFIAIWHNDIRSTLKGKILEYMAMKNPHSADIFIGDGGSDKPALDAHETTAVYFALDGYGFSKELAHRNECQFTYKDFNDVMQTMDKINAEALMLRTGKTIHNEPLQAA